MNISELWKSEAESDWLIALDHYWDYVDPSNMVLEKKLDNIDSNIISQMPLDDFYNFLIDEYFRWKFTDFRWLQQNKEHFAKYVYEERLEELSQIQKQLFLFDLNDIKSGLEIACSINGLGIAGGSGLLSILFPGYFGTVDQYVIKALCSIEDLPEKSVLQNMKQTNISLSSGIILVKIMKNKASELNFRFKNSIWTPRAIDKILWSTRNTSMQTHTNISHTKEVGYSCIRPQPQCKEIIVHGITVSNAVSRETKQQLRQLYAAYLTKNNKIDSVDTYFTDAIFILNNSSSLGLDFVDTLLNDRDFSKYHLKLVEHFTGKGWDNGKAIKQANDYVKKISMFRNFIEE